MKTKIVINDNLASIELTPQNPFEKDLLEKVFDRRSDFKLTAEVTAKQESFMADSHKDHKLVIDIVGKQYEEES